LESEQFLREPLVQHLERPVEQLKFGAVENIDARARLLCHQAFCQPGQARLLQPASVISPFRLFGIEQCPQA
jgi:hypothetical protein